MNRRGNHSLRSGCGLLLAGFVILAVGFSDSRQLLADQAPARRPNILLIMIDDLGWMDLACQGNPLVETPHLDQLAREGVRFTNAYAAAPVCSPTRAAVITGLAPARLKITNHTPDRPQFTPDEAKLDPAFMHNHLAAERVTLAERLHAAGYATAFLGKWHLSGPGRGRTEYEPQHQGFDINIGGCGYGGPPTFFDPYRIPNLVDRRAGEYLPDRLTDEAIRFLEQQRQESTAARPFFLCLWNYTVHWPMEAPAGLLKKYETRTGPGLNDTRYGAMIEAMDAAIGRLVKRLDELQLRDNTLVIFTSDNGGFGGVADNRPLRAAKGYLYEGGIRVPLIIRWPGVTRPGTTCDVPVISMDYCPTILEACDVATASGDEFDGVSLMPVLRGEQSLSRDALYFHYPNYAWHRSNRLGSAIRSGKYKLIEYFDDLSVELYDLEKDLGEQQDLSGQLPEIAERLRSRLKQWRTSVGAELPSPRT